MLQAGLGTGAGFSPCLELGCEGPPGAGRVTAGEGLGGPWRVAGRGSRARGSRAPRAGLVCLAGPAPGHGSRSIPSPEAAWQTLGTLSSALPSPKSKQSILSATSAQLCPGREGPCTKAWNGPPSLGHSPPGCEIRWAETAGGSTGRPRGGGEAGQQLTGPHWGLWGLLLLWGNCVCADL